MVKTICPTQYKKRTDAHKKRKQRKALYKLMNNADYDKTMET